MVVFFILKDWVFLLGMIYLIWLLGEDFKNIFWLFSFRAEKASNNE